MTFISERQRTCFYTHKKQNKCETFFFFLKEDTLQKTRQFVLRFYSQKTNTLLYAIFHEIFDFGIYIYTKSMTLCVM